MKLLLTITTLVLLCGQHDQYIQSIREWQAEINAEYKDPEESPLTKKDRKKFETLAFFPIDTKYRVAATFIRTPNQMPFTMPTTTDRLPVYEQYGEVHFELDGKQLTLPIYQSHSLKTSEEYKNYLFLPFTDLSNGFESYGGGRYLDLQIPNGETMIIDFNKAYNPYCAYNDQYSCPIPPRANDLSVKILAGVKAWEDH